jgi:hypothetical protein
MEGTGSYSLPEDLALAEVARTLRGTGQWGWVVDSRWLLVYVTNDSRLTTGGGVELAPYPIGSHLFGPEAVRTGPRWRFGANTPEFVRGMFAGLGSLAWCSPIPRVGAIGCASWWTRRCVTRRRCCSPTWCATGGRALASKDLVERLDRDDAAAPGPRPQPGHLHASQRTDDGEREGPTRRTRHRSVRVVGPRVRSTGPLGIF